MTRSYTMNATAIFIRSLLKLGAALALLAAVSQAVGQVSGKQPSEADAARFAGCYELHMGRWWPWGMGEDTGLVTPPSLVELTTKRGKKGFDKDELLIREIPPAQRSRGGSWWVPKSKREVLLIWTNGFSGVSVTLKGNEKVLRGWAHAHFDFFRPPHVAHVTAKPASCSTVIRKTTD